MRKDIKISVVVPLNNRHEITLHTLPNLIRTSSIAKHEFILVLDEVKDEGEVRLANKLEKTGIVKKIIYKKKASCEVDVAMLGFKHASGDFYIYLASDLVFHNFYKKDWMREQCLILKNHKEIGTVTLCRKSPITAAEGRWARIGIKRLKSDKLFYIIGNPTTRQFAIRKKDWESVATTIGRYKDGRWEVAFGEALSKRGLLHVESNDLSAGYLHIGMKGGVLINDKRLWTKIRNSIPEMTKAYERGLFCPPIDGLELLD